MKTAHKMSGADRRTAIIRAARNVFVEKGFKGTTTRELAEAAGISEALLFKHFPSKEAIYSAIVTLSCEDAGSRIHERLQSLAPSTSSLVFLVRDLVGYILGERTDEIGRNFFRLVLRSLMDEGEFTRLAIQGGPLQWVRKLAECVEAAKAAGDMHDVPGPPSAGGWFVHMLLAGILLHSLPGKSVIDYGVSQEDLMKQVARFCLLGIGLKDEAIRRCWKEIDTCKA